MSWRRRRNYKSYRGKNKGPEGLNIVVGLVTTALVLVVALVLSGNKNERKAGWAIIGAVILLSLVASLGDV